MAKSALVLGDYGLPHLVSSGTGALFAMQHNGWDHALKVTADGAGLVGHAGAVLLRKAADQAGLTAQLSTALRKAGNSPVFDRGIVLVSMAAAIALGATSMSDIAVLAHLAPVLGDAPSGPTARRAWTWPARGHAGPDRPCPREGPRARVAADRGHSGRVPVAGHRREGPDRVAGHRHGRHPGHRQFRQGGSRSHLEEGLRLPPAGRLARQYPRVPGHAAPSRQRRLEHVHRPSGGAGRGDPAGPRPVPAEDPGPRRRAGASHELVRHLLSLSSARRSVLFTCGWMITAADEDAIRQVPAGAWKPGTGQDGAAEDDKDVAEVTRLMSRAGNWPDGLRWIARRVKPSRRHLRNLTDYEKKTGWKYSITCTNIPGTGIAGVPGSHHPQYLDTVHREHAVVETAGVRTAKAMGLRNLPSKTWQVNCGWVIAANIAADLTAWTRFLGFRDDPDLQEADPERSATGSGTSPPGSPATPASASSRSAPAGPGRTRSSPAGSGYALCKHPPDQHEPSRQHERRTTRRGRSRCAPGHPGHRHPSHRRQQTGTRPETGHQHNQ